MTSPATPAGLPRDVRNLEQYAFVAEWFARTGDPAADRVVDVTDVTARPDGRSLACTVHLRTGSASVSSIAVLDLSGGVRVLPDQPAARRRPAWSPDGTLLACLEQAPSGHERAVVLEADGRPHAPCPDVGGSVESASWSPDGSRLLLLVAESGAEISDVYGSGRVASTDDGPAWLPRVAADEVAGRRRLAVWEPATGTVTRVPLDRNVWEAAWGGPAAAVAVTSPLPGEDSWYDGRLTVVRLDGSVREIPLGPQQTAVPRATPSGEVVSALVGRASDRDLLAGELHLVDLGTGVVTPVDTLGVHVTGQQWRDEDRLVFAGLRDGESVVGEHDRRTGAVRELFATSQTVGPADLLPAAAPVGDDSDVALVLECGDRPPALCLVAGGVARVLFDTAHGGSPVAAVPRPQRLTWASTDGLTVSGLLHRPDGPARGLVLLVHGGPVWCWSDMWPGRHPALALLRARGFAVLLPNPRGSQGRGPSYVEAVVGEIGGRDGDDVLAGAAAVVAAGIVPAGRVAVMGTSYGGFLSAWLATRPGAVAAAVAVSPATDWVSQHHTTNIPASDVRFLSGGPLEPGSHYVTRSPLHAVTSAAAPTLLTAGLLDLATPAGQAVEFSRALAEHGVPTDLAVYPLEGHDVHRAEAVLDHLTRILWWLEAYLPSG